MSAAKKKPMALQEAINHAREFRHAWRLVSRKMEDIDGPLGDKYAAAFLRVKSADPASAKSIDAYVTGLFVLIGALNEALYRECERRVLGPAIGVSRAAARKARRKASASPAAAAKVEARRLWPSQKWTAKTLWGELTKRGHKVALTTVQSWVTEFRR